MDELPNYAQVLVLVACSLLGILLYLMGVEHGQEKEAKKHEQDADWGKWEVIEENVFVSRLKPIGPENWDEPEQFHEVKVDKLKRVHNVTGDIQYKTIDRI